MMNAPSNVDDNLLKNLVLKKISKKINFLDFKFKRISLRSTNFSS